LAKTQEIGFFPEPLGRLARIKKASASKGVEGSKDVPVSVDAGLFDLSFLG
jgi:hypothetical protein